MTEVVEAVTDSTSNAVSLFDIFDIDFGQILADMLQSFGTSLISDMLVLLNDCIETILGGMLRVETLIDNSVVTVLTSAGIADIYAFIYMVAVALIGLKLLFKGWQIYILWRDGDADNSPVDMLVGSAQAAVVIVAFPTLYEYAADITLYVANGIIGTIGVYEDSATLDLSGVVQTVPNGLVDVLLLLIYFIMLFILWIILLKRGFELLILRLGVPLACVGLIDSDMGLFKNYLLTLYKTLITTVIQMVAMSLSIKLALTCSFINIILGIAAAFTAFGAPVIMQGILIPTGGGVTSKIHTASMAANGIRRLFGK